MAVRLGWTDYHILSPISIFDLSFWNLAESLIWLLLPHIYVFPRACFMLLFNRLLISVTVCVRHFHICVPFSDFLCIDPLHVCGNAANLEYKTRFFYRSENFFCFVLQIGCIPMMCKGSIQFCYQNLHNHRISFKYRSSRRSRVLREEPPFRPGTIQRL